MKYILLLLLSLSLSAESTFITPLEYASQLYKNPRGIGCQHCHGNNGEGKLVAKYKHENEDKEFRGPVIHSMNFKDFHKALNKRKTGMPRYFLTKKEVQALFLFLQQEKKNAN
ncbi:MAG: mono/diheme cytochrome c family protein [Sulfurimonas sp.]|jgi:mono/diheme cytochrome c family protein|uniref:c-type cytochrome n=1 Tax=Sulfurimonas sp. TaxID=2022749 RepID=UPI0039E44351